jgi:hypothetical protein
MRENNMTIGELIKELQKYPDALDVCIYDESTRNGGREEIIGFNFIDEYVYEITGEYVAPNLCITINTGG